MRRAVIVYHGTDRKSARSIRESWFREGTWFARHLEDALGFGGSYVFEVVMESSRLPSHVGGWQFMTAEAVPITQIQALRVYKQKVLMEDRLLRELVFESNLPMKQRAAARKEFEKEVSDAS